MPEPPGQLGLVGRLEALERRLSDAVRRGPRFPTCVVALDAGGFASLHSTDMWPYGNWHAVYDPSGMFRKGDADTLSTIRVPAAGLYLAHFHVSFGSNGNGLRAAKITVNGRDVTQHTVASDLKGATTAGEGAILDAISTFHVYDVGDLIYWSCWQNSGGNVGVNADLSSGPTAITVRYLGSA